MKHGSHFSWQLSDDTHEAVHVNNHFLFTAQTAVLLR